LGVNYLYPSDEWYLVAGREPPPAEDYDGFPQLENGVGMVRQLLSEWDALKRNLGSSDSVAATVVCGTLIAPVLAGIVDEWNKLTSGNLHLVPVVNEFFGSVTTVSGLLTGRDVLSALRGRALGDAVLLPRAMFVPPSGTTCCDSASSPPPRTTLDDLGLDDLGRTMRVPSEMAGTLREARLMLRKHCTG
jgi:NifB/MoaA-like Fe-S oxidoreductase